MGLQRKLNRTQKRRSTRSFVFIASFCASLIASSIGNAAPADLKQTLRDNVYEIHLENGEIAGSGKEFIVRAVRNSQFVALGEEHNNADIPEFTTALLRLLHRAYGYNYLALEQDPVMMQRVSEPPLRGNVALIDATAKRYLMGFTFDSDAELAMLAQAGALVSGRGHAIWGCDQAFGETHILDELIRYAPNTGVKNNIAALRGEAAEAESTRDLAKGTFMQTDAAASASATLEREFSTSQAERARYLVDTLAKSSELYGYFTAGERGDIPGHYTNNDLREDYLKGRFLAEYRYAERRDGRPPKVLMKFGHFHLFRGLSPVNIPSLGNFVNDLARANDKSFFSIAIFPFNETGKYGAFAGKDWNRYLQGLAPVVASKGWTLIDLRPLREYPYFKALKNADPPLSDAATADLVRLVYGFDAVLFMADSVPASHSATGVAY